MRLRLYIQNDDVLGLIFESNERQHILEPPVFLPPVLPLVEGLLCSNSYWKPEEGGERVRVAVRTGIGGK